MIYRIIKKAILIVFLPVCFLVSCKAERDTQLILRIGHPMAPGNNVTLGYEKFKELVEKKSGGRIIIKIYPDALLGNDLVTMNAVRNGDLEIASSSTPNLAGISKKFMAFDLPYIILPEGLDRLYISLNHGELGRYVDEISAESGLKPLMHSEYGYRNFATVSRELRVPSDMTGLRIRTTQSPVDIDVTGIFGAIPVSLVWADTYPALIRRTIDGEGNTLGLLYSARHHKHLKYVTLTRHNFSLHILMINRNLWDGLDDKTRMILKSSADEALLYERAITRDLENEAMKQMRDSGVKITELTNAELQLWKKKSHPVRGKYAAEIPEKLIDLIINSQR